MKRLVRALTIAALLIPGMWIASSGNAARLKSSPLFEEVLQAHGGRGAIGSVSSFHAKAVRLTSTRPPEYIERKLTVSAFGPWFKRHIVDPLGLIEQFELFDGQVGYYSVVEKGTAVDQPRLMDSERLRAVKFSIDAYGLVPILQTCSGPAVEAVFLERTPRSLDKFAVRTEAGEWFVYVDRSHRIVRVDIGDKILQFADYRSVNGLQLPFIQRMSLGSQLIYQLTFSTIELNPSFPTGYFSREAFGQNLK